MRNDVWIVTGASQGLGLAVTKYLLEKGKKVCATSRNKSKLIEQIAEENESFLPFQISNLSDVNSIDELKNKVIEKFGRVDVILNNAGYSEKGPVELVSMERVKTNYQIDVYSVIAIMKEFEDVFKKQNEGLMITITSSAAFRANPGAGIYSSCKYALQGLCEAYRKEMQEYGVKVTAVLPGGMNTNFHKNVKEDQSVMNDDYRYALEVIKNARAYPNIPLQNANPEGVAEMLLIMSEMKNPPENLFMGSDCMRHAREHLNTLERDLYLNKELSNGID